MRFMAIVKAGKDSEAGKMPSEELLAAMGKYNDELMKAGRVPAPHGEGLSVRLPRTGTEMIFRSPGFE